MCDEEPKRKGMALTPEGQDLYDNYLANYEDSTCYCNACSMPPCGYCEGAGADPGHPLSLEEDDSVWEDILISEVRKATAL